MANVSKHLGSSCIRIACFGVFSGVEGAKKDFTRSIHSIQAATEEASIHSTSLLDPGCYRGGYSLLDPLTRSRQPQMKQQIDLLAPPTRSIYSTTAVDELIGRSGPDRIKPLDPLSSTCFTTSTNHSTPSSSRRPRHFAPPLDHMAEYHQLHHLTITRSHHSTPWSSTSITFTRSLTRLHGRPSITISITRIYTRLPALESSPFRTQPNTRAQGRKEDSSSSLDHSLDHLVEFEPRHFRAQKVFDEMSEPLIPEIRGSVPRLTLVNGD
ncbi:hypothetical protein [Arabidopsis thaliana]|uniref:F10A2.13 protein n=1 Tax=Arabidopsis thaliana TaxID=3702 RepID=Q9XH29_ARATH|nr:F10A2.13 gene product [Arabidopsis thaliana]CAB81135.1 hypothetical protein [Arabidopsis thaliana]